MTVDLILTMQSITKLKKEAMKNRSDINRIGFQINGRPYRSEIEWDKED